MAEIDVFFEQELGFKVWGWHLSMRNSPIIEIQSELKLLDYPMMRGIAGVYYSLLNRVQNHEKRRA